MSLEMVAWAVKQRLPALQKIVLMMLADRTNGETRQCNPSMARLADDCGMSKETVKRSIKALEVAGLLTILRQADDDRGNLPNQYDLNPNADGPKVGSGGTSGGGVRKPPKIGSVSPPAVGSSRPPNQEYINQEGNQEEAPHAASGAPPPKPPPRGSRLPEGWEPTIAGGQFAASLGLVVSHVLAKFRDHWRSQPGQRGLKLDWDATWRNWCRNEDAPPETKPRFRNGFAQNFADQHELLPTFLRGPDVKH